MQKPWYLSKSFWGAILLSLAAILPTMPFLTPYADLIQSILGGIGTFFGITGIRDAIAANGKGV